MNNLLSEADTKTVLNILVDHLGVPAAQLTSEARLREDLGADSLEDVEIIMALEEQFNLTIPDEITERISTVGDLFETLAELLEKRSRG